MPDSVLKTAWSTYRFDQMATMVNDRVDDPSQAGVEYYVGLEHLDSDSLAIRRWGSPTDVEATKLRFCAGDIIFGRRRVYQRKLAVAQFDGICSAHAMVLRAKPSVVLPEFLPFFMQSDLFMERAKEISVGSLSPTINWKTLAKEAFDLPPLEEQRRIAAVAVAVSLWQETVKALSDSVAELKRSFCRDLAAGAQGRDWVLVGDVAKFSSGAQLRVGGLPQEPTAEARVPVYGGNGIAGYTVVPLAGCSDSTLVIGRVGQLCGVTQLTCGPAWITDNALYPVEMVPETDVRFLAACLEGADLNRGKLGEYLPLVTQQVIHRTPIPKLDLARQRQAGERYMEILAAAEAASRRLDETRSVSRRMIGIILGGEGAG